MTDEAAADLRITVSARVSPTEDPERVRLAILNLFPDVEVEQQGSEMRAQASSLERIRELIANHRIPDTARVVMLRGRPDREGSTITRFTMGKQAAYVGRPAFAPPEGPLGEVHVEVEAPSADALESAIYLTAPDTTVDASLARVPPAKRPEPDLSEPS